MLARLPYLGLLLLPLIATGCVGDYVIFPGPGGIILLIAVIVVVAGINKLWGQQINHALAKMASAWMKGRER